MPETIEVGRNTSEHEISAWAKHSRDVRFVLSADSSFSLGKEGLAVCALNRILKTREHTSFHTTFDVETALEKQKTILFSLFGLCLLSGAPLVDTRGAAKDTDRVFEAMWKLVRTGGGNLGSGRARWIVARDPDMPVPDCLGGDRSGIRFPLRQHFAAVLADERKRLLGQPRESEVELRQSFDDLMTFLFEAAKNAHEHGHHRDDGQPIPGIRGILIEKIVFSDAELERRSFAAGLRDYLCRADTRGIVTAYTIVDSGLGIQNTLPARPTESPIARLNRAFLDGETRKPRGIDVEAGRGLTKLREACVRTKAFLSVKSADVLVERDFSTFSEEAGLHQRVDVEFAPQSGTALTLVIPDLAPRAEKQLGLL